MGVAVLAVLAACSRAPAPAASAPPPAMDPVPWRYEVSVRGPDLQIEARFAPGVTGAPHVDSDATPFVRDLTTTTEAGWRVVRYRFALREAAEQHMDVDTAVASGDVVVAPPSTWLLRPDAATPGSFRFHVVTVPPARFAAATHPSLDGAPDTYEARKAAGSILNPDSIAENYWMLHCQPPDAWTHELDLRPWSENW